MIAIKLIRALALTGAIGVLLPGAVQAAGPLRVHFKLDDSLTQGLQMGEVLVSPASFDTVVVQGSQLSVEAEARLPDIIGDPETVAATFTSADPAKVAVGPAAGKRVTLSINGCNGPSTVTVSARARTTQLTVNPICVGDTIRATITQ